MKLPWVSGFAERTSMNSTLITELFWRPRGQEGDDIHSETAFYRGRCFRGANPHLNSPCSRPGSGCG